MPEVFLPDTFEGLSSADMINVIKHDLRNLRATPDDGRIPGLGDKVKPLYHGKSICRRLESAGVLTQVFWPEYIITDS